MRNSNAVKVWKAPEIGRLKCSVGVAWDKKSKLVGLGWLVRNAEGSTVLHSRRAFNGAQSLLEAKRLGLLWSAESMISHRIHKVTFELKYTELKGSFNRPKEWPAYRGYGVEIIPVLINIAEWEVDTITRDSNRAAFLIARNVTREKRLQSYVAQGSPAWLRSVIEEEATRTAVG